ncbi:unnamed protein product, partial [marine sediment metagenome]
MTEFEKWLKKDSIESGILYDCYHDKDCRKGWKAALKRILKIKKQGHQLAYYDADILMAIENEIK